MIRKDHLPPFVTLLDPHTTIKGPLLGIAYDAHECFETVAFIEDDLAEFVSCLDSSGNVVHLPAILLEKAEVCPWKEARAV